MSVYDHAVAPSPRPVSESLFEWACVPDPHLINPAVTIVV
jgi:hypothetical protein